MLPERRHQALQGKSGRYPNARQWRPRAVLWSESQKCPGGKTGKTEKGKPSARAPIITTTANSLLESPRGCFGPFAHDILCPDRGFVLVTGSARVGNPVFVGHLRRNEPEGMSMDKSAGNALCFDFRHMTGHASTAGAAGFMVCMLFESGRARTVRRRQPMTIQTYPISGLT